MKFESTKSLASTSSRSLGGALSENGDRETTLQNVLSFIAEQQKYAQCNRDGPTRPCSVNEITKEFNIEGPPQQMDDIKNSDSDYSLPKSSDNENYVTLKQLCEEFGLKDKESKDKDVELKNNTIKENGSCKVGFKDASKIGKDQVNDTTHMKIENVDIDRNKIDTKTIYMDKKSSTMVGNEKATTERKKTDTEKKSSRQEKNKVIEFNADENIKQNIAYAEEVCLVTPLDVESENCSNMSIQPVDICSVNVEINTSFYQNSEHDADEKLDCDNLVMTTSDLTKSSDTSYSDLSTANCTSESLTSSVSTPDTVVSKIPRRKTPSRIPISPARIAAANSQCMNNNNNNQKDSNGVQETRIPKSKIPHKSNKSKLKVS